MHNVLLVCALECLRVPCAAECARLRRLNPENHPHASSNQQHRVVIIIPGSAWRPVHRAVEAAAEGRPLRLYFVGRSAALGAFVCVGGRADVCLCRIFIDLTTHRYEKCECKCVHVCAARVNTT